MKGIAVMYAVEVPRTLEDVARYLINAYNIPADEAIQLVKKRIAIFECGKKYGSFTYYIGDEMLRAERLKLPKEATYAPYEAVSY
jgi:hypothetical protein